jgi:hypothetical protein
MRDPHPSHIDCESCPHLAYRVFSPAAVVDDFPEHYNWSLGCVVKSRKHHEQIQRERNLQDWVPVKEAPMFGKLRKEGHQI